MSKANLLHTLMSVNNSQLINIRLGQYVTSLFFVGLVGVFLTVPPAFAEKPLTDLVVSTHKGSEIQLEVRQIPMLDVLKMITAKTGVPIHYSVLPDGLVTATCVGSTLKHVLECLLDRKADLIVRYPRNTDKAENKGQLAEAWVLGSRLDGAIAKVDCSVPDKSISSSSLNLSQQEAEARTKPNQADALLKIARSKNVAGRADAIGALLAVGTKDNPEIQTMLEDAVHDKDANVRAQALSTLTHWSTNRESINSAIQDGIHDESADVRMMAVDGITDDVALLQQAVNDSDEVVRTLATTKLEELMKQQNNN